MKRADLAPPAGHRAAMFPLKLDDLAGVYRSEVRRLADLYGERVRAGEFDGSTPPPNDHPRWFALMHELERHPWASRTAVARAILAVSPWALSSNAESTLPYFDSRTVLFPKDGLRSVVGECLACDVIAEAKKRAPRAAKGRQSA